MLLALSCGDVVGEGCCWCMATNNGQIVGIYSVTSELIKELRKGKDASSNYSIYIAGTYGEALEGCSPVYMLCIYVYIYIII